MFKLEYVLKRNGPKYESSYPSEGDYNNNIFLLRGRNDLGKSTAMQVVALGLFGLNLDDKDIRSEIKAKMRRLISEDTEEFNFKFIIESQDKENKIESTLPDKNIENLNVTINGRPLNKTEFLDHYKLIFDIPDEVTKKLIDSLSTVKTQIADYISMVNSYGRNIQSIIDELDSFEKKEARLIEKQSDFASLKSQKNAFEERLKKIEPKRNDLRKAYIVKNYSELTSELEKLVRQNQDLHKKVDPKTAKWRKTRSETTKENLKDNLVKFKLEVDSFQKLCVGQSFEKDIKETKELIDLLKNINDSEEFSEDVLDKCLNIIQILTNKFDQIKFKPDSEKENEFELLDKVIGVLKSYLPLNPEIPGTNGKTLTQFLDSIEKRYDTLKSCLSETTKFKKAQEILLSFPKEISKLKEQARKIYNATSEVGEGEEDISKKIQENEEEQARVTSMLDKIEEEYEALSPDEKIIDYSTFDMDYYDNLEKECGNIKKELEILKREIEVDEGIIDGLENNKKPQTKLSKEALNKKSKLIDNIKSKMIKWSSYLTNIVGDEIINKSKVDKESHDFYDALGNYLAYTLEYIYFEGSKWKLEKIDLENEAYVVLGRQPIMYVDVGTGNTALNSLMARIKQDYDGKKKILLLDDIGLMDNTNIKRLIDEIKRQAKKGEILLAILSIADKELDRVVAEPISINVEMKNEIAE